MLRNTLIFEIEVGKQDGKTDHRIVPATVLVMHLVTVL